MDFLNVVIEVSLSDLLNSFLMVEGLTHVLAWHQLRLLSHILHESHLDFRPHCRHRSHYRCHLLIRVCFDVFVRMISFNYFCLCNCDLVFSRYLGNYDRRSHHPSCFRCLSSFVYESCFLHHYTSAELLSSSLYSINSLLSSYVSTFTLKF